MQTFIIKDWMGNLIEKAGEFKTFEDAWDCLYININDEEAYQEYFVEEKGK